MGIDSEGKDQEEERVRDFLREPHPDYHSYPQWKRRCAELGEGAIPVCIEVLQEGSETMQEQLTAILCLKEHGYRAGADWEYGGAERTDGPPEGYWIVPPGQTEEILIVPRILPTKVLEFERDFQEQARRAFAEYDQGTSNQ